MTDLRPGDKVSGGRLERYYAEVEWVTGEAVGIRYNGEVRRVPAACGSSLRTSTVRTLAKLASRGEW